MAKRRTLKEKLEAAWQDRAVRSPLGSVRWLEVQTHVRHKPAADNQDLFYCPAQKRQMLAIRKRKCPKLRNTSERMSKVICHTDFETFSTCDLKSAGAYKYAQDPSTDCLLTSGLVGREARIRRWRPGDPYPYADIHPDDIEIHAWNSQFERLIWRHVMVPRYGWPKLALEQFVCVSAQARITAAGPAKLDIAGKFFNRRHKKDNKGHLHMLKMCRPATDAQQNTWLKQQGGEWSLDEEQRCHHTPEALDRLHDYCDQDVWTEVDVHDMLPPWQPDDLADFHLNERINDQGVVIDRDFAQAATRYAEEEKLYFANEIRRISGGAVETPRQFQRIQQWLLPLLSDEAQDVCKWYDNGVAKYSFDADTRANLLSEAASDLDWIAYDPRDAEMIVDFIEMMDAAGKSSIAKYQALCDRAIVDRDGNPRIHGLYVFAGASQSGRFSSSGIQAHNLVRAVPGNAKPLITAFKHGENTRIQEQVKAWGTSVGKASPQAVHALGQLIRPAFTGCPQGDFDLVWGDWSSIEACALPWLSLHPDAEDRLSLLRRGEDIYLKTASAILGRKITKEDKDERQSYGKVPELSLGYLGGAGAFKAMAKNYGVRLPEKKIIGIVKSWREDNPWATSFGMDCEKAAMAALRRKDGASFSAGRLEYWYNPDALDGIGCLYCVLPSKRAIPYPGARIQLVVPKWGGEHMGITAMKSAWHPKKGEPWENWPRVSLWKGLLIENCLAHNTEVLTNRGWVCIQNVQQADLLWDGLEWVAHSGLAQKGVQTCMQQFGVWMTPDHEVLCERGWLPAAEAQRSRHDRAAVRLPDSFAQGPHTRKSGLVALSLRLRGGESAVWQRGAARKDTLMWLYASSMGKRSTHDTRYEQAPRVCGMAFDARPLRTTYASGMAQLRRAWRKGMHSLAHLRSVLGRYGAVISARAHLGPSTERLWVYAGQLPMGNLAGARQQYAGEPHRANAKWRNDRGASQSRIWREAKHYPIPAGERLDGFGCGDDTAELQQFPVYDILNAGPRRRFTVRGVDGPLIVHNCTQGICADLMRLGLWRAEQAGLTVCMHTHDEVVIETPKPEEDAAVLHRLMTKRPPWPGGDMLPLRADVEYGFRYKLKFKKAV